MSISAPVNGIPGSPNRYRLLQPAVVSWLASSFYSEPLQGSTFVTKAITPDKVSVPIPDIRISYLTPTPYRFAIGGNALIFS